MTFDEIFKRCSEIHDSKIQDYTSTGQGFENFIRSGEIASWFRCDVDKPYVVLIGTKLARLASLLGAKEPKNESIDDTFLDLVNYCTLWASRRTKPTVQELKEILEPVHLPTRDKIIDEVSRTPRASDVFTDDIPF